MRKLQTLTLLSIGIMASASGFIQAQATDYTYFVDFSTKQVANFNDYDQIFLDTTYSLDNTIQYTANTFYRMNACPPSVASGVTFQIRYQLNGSGTTYQTNIGLPDMACTTVNTPYSITGEISIPRDHLNYLINDDANYLFLSPFLLFDNTPAATGRIIYLTTFEFVLTINYDFGTTYLFNYFLSDTQQTTVDIFNATPSGTRITDFEYVMTTAGNDRYFILNSVFTNFGTSRRRFAIDYEMEYFRGDSIGSQYRIIQPNIQVNNTSTSVAWIRFNFNYYYLNAANNSQAIVDAPEFNFTYEDCGWDLFDIPCFINNGLAYITNDAPIISDAITLLNAGIAMAAQTFGIIGAFTTDNVFGYLILAGFGFVAVRWFLKND